MGVNILGILSFIADLAPLILLLLYNKLLKDPVYLTLFFWTILSITSDIIIAFSSLEKQQIIVFFAIITEMLFVATMFFLVVKYKLIKIIILMLSILYIIVFSISIRQNEIYSFPYKLASITVVMTLMMCLFVFYDLFKQNKITFILNNPVVFIVLAYIIYVAGNLFLFASTEQFPNIFKDPGLWSIFIIANIFKNSFIVVSIYRKQHNENDLEN